MKSIDDLKRETTTLVRAEHESRLDRKAKDKILDAFDRMCPQPRPARCIQCGQGDAGITPADSQVCMQCAKAPP